jgi:hypothetical protein
VGPGPRVQVGWGSKVQLVGLRSDFVHLEVCHVLPVFLKSSRRLMVFDYDGTLTAVTDRHESVRASPSSPTPTRLRARAYAWACSTAALRPAAGAAPRAAESGR